MSELDGTVDIYLCSSDNVYSNTSLLPRCVQDKNNLALEECVKTALNVNTEDLILYPLENLSQKFYNTMAKEMHITGFEGWNFAKTDEERKELIINSLIQHSKKGSVPSMENVLAFFGIEAKIQEFWEYGGKIGHYILKFVNLYGRSLTKELEETINKIIKSYAPKSRILDYINYFICTPGFVYIADRTRLIDKTIVRTNGVIL